MINYIVFQPLIAGSLLLETKSYQKSHHSGLASKAFPMALHSFDSTKPWGEEIRFHRCKNLNINLSSRNPCRRMDKHSQWNTSMVQTKLPLPNERNESQSIQRKLVKLNSWHRIGSATLFRTSLKTKTDIRLLIVTATTYWLSAACLDFLSHSSS